MTATSPTEIATSERLAELRRLRESMNAVCDEVATGALTLREVLDLAAGSDARARAAANLYVVAVAEASPSLGKVAARRLLAALGIPETTKLGDLTPRHRGSLLEETSA